MAECRTILNERGQTVEETNNDYVEHQNDHQHQDRLEDHPSLRLLFTIAHHVNYSKANLECLATDVVMGKGLFTQRTVDVHDVQSKIKKVFTFWHESTVDLTVRGVIEQVRNWIRKNLLFDDVWRDIEKLVPFPLPQPHEPSITETTPKTCIPFVPSSNSADTLSTETVPKTCINSISYVPSSNSVNLSATEETAPKTCAHAQPIEHSSNPTDIPTLNTSPKLPTPPPPPRVSSTEETVSCFPFLRRQKRFKKLIEWTKQSLRDKPFSTAKGKIWTDTPNNIPLKEIFTKLCWRKNCRKTHGVVTEELSDITQILNVKQLGKNGPVRILVQGPGGIGKSTAMKHLALCWADGTVTSLRNFDFIFHIALKDVRSGETIAKIIIQQHKGLHGNNVHPEEVKVLLEGYPKLRILILLDGHDEYTPGGNTEIDQALNKDFLRNCWIIVTSRETKHLNKVREYTDAEAIITGFDEERVEEYITKYLGCQETCDRFLNATQLSGLHQAKGYGILCIPIMLHMVCVLFLSEDSLPKSKSGILSAITDRCIDWETIRSTGERCTKDVTRALLRLGKLALIGLQRDHSQQTFRREEVLEIVGDEGLKLGLLIRTQSSSTQEVETELFCFHYLLLQEFVAGKYVATLPKAQLQKVFPTWESILKHREVIRFACGLAAGDQSILEFVYETLTQHCRQQADTKDIGKWLLDQCNSFPRSLCEEISEFVSIDPLHNRFINYINAFDTTISIPSRFYVFNPGRVYMFNDAIDSSTMKYVVNEYNRSSNNADDLPSECAIYRMKGNDELWNTLKVIQQIRKHQEVVISHLVLSSFVGSENESGLDLDGLEIAHARSLKFEWCAFPRNSFIHLIQQLNGCEMLTHLDLRGTLGVPVEFGQALATMRSLEVLDLRLCQMKTPVSGAVLAGLSKSCKLRILVFSNNSLKGCLSKLLNGSDNHTFEFLERLLLDHTKLSQPDLACLSVAANDGKLPKLQKLQLPYNTLRDRMADLLGPVEFSGFKSLTVLDLTKTKLNKSDMEKLNSAAQVHKLSKLTNLYLSHNPLTDCVQALLRNPTRSMFESLETLWMTDASLSKIDVMALSRLMRDGILSKLRVLHLEGNCLTECMGDFLSDLDDYKFRLVELNLRSSQLTNTDLKNISFAVNSNMFPELMYLNIGLHNESNSQNAVERLIKICMAKYSREPSLEDQDDEQAPMRLWFSGATFHSSFCNRMKSLCQKCQIDLRI